MEEYDEELEEIKKRKMLEYQRRLAEAAQAEEERKLEEAKRQEFLRKILTPEARARLNNLKMVKPELAEAIESQLIQLAYSGRVPTPVTDDLLKELLKKITDAQKELKLKYIRGSSLR